MKYSWDFTAKKKSVFPIDCLDAQVRNSVSDQGPNTTADAEVSSSRFGRGPDGLEDTEVSKFPFAQGSNENAMIADEEMFFMQPYRC
jgi:hypothetical protein